MPFIYLSYRSGDDGGYVESFLRDLCDAVDRSGPPGTRTEVFLGSDRSVEGGAWPPAAATALAECTTFLAVCSERYFLTERCGREWWSFVDRCRQQEAATSRRSPAMVPLCWGFEQPRDRLPAGRYVSDVGWGEDVRALSRLRAHRDRYQDLIDRIARHILDEGRTPVRRAATVLPYDATPNAFAAEPFGFRAAPVPTQDVHFVVAAGRWDEMAPIRDDLAFYGDRPADWRPYQPQTSEPLVRRAQAVATEHLFHSHVVDDVEEIADAVESAGIGDHLVVLLVDAWAVRIDAYRRALVEIDRRGGASVAVLVPISAGDPESVREQGPLGSGVARVLKRSGRLHDPMVRVGPDSSEEFEEALGQILETARNMAYSTAPVRRIGLGAAPRRLPVLEAP